MATSVSKDNRGQFRSCRESPGPVRSNNRDSMGQNMGGLGVCEDNVMEKCL